MLSITNAKSVSLCTLSLNHMKILFKLTLASVPMLVTGCNFTEMASMVNSSPDLYIPPTTQLQVSLNQTALVSGFDVCPDRSVDWFIAPSTKVFSNSCILIKPDTKRVRVSMRIGDSDFDEVWKVSYQDEKLKLTRPNGFEVLNPVHS